MWKHGKFDGQYFWPTVWEDIVYQAVAKNNIDRLEVMFQFESTDVSNIAGRLSNTIQQIRALKLETLEMLLARPEFKPSYYSNNLLIMLLKTNRFDLIKLLLADDRVDLDNFKVSNTTHNVHATRLLLESGKVKLDSDQARALANDAAAISAALEHYTKEEEEPAGKRAKTQLCIACGLVNATLAEKHNPRRAYCSEECAKSIYYY